MRDPYQTLGVDPDATDEEIKAAYRQKAKEYHPDQGGDAEKFKEVQEAYQKIENGEVGTSDKEWEFDGGFPGTPDIEQDFGSRDKEAKEFIEDFINFTQAGGFNSPGFQGFPFDEPSFNQTYETQVDFRMAVFGGNVKVQTPEVGFTSINVPTGVQDGDEVVMESGEKVRFRVTNNTKYWRQNENDIYVRRKISAFDAMTGTDLTIDKIDGNSVKVPMNPGTSDGEYYRLSGEGGPETYQGKPQGDMYIEIDVEIPAIREESKLELIEKIQKQYQKDE